MNNLISMKMDVRYKKYTIGLYDIFILCALPSNIFIFSASFLLVSFRSSQWSFLRAPLCSWVDCTSFFSCALWISIWTWRFVQSSTGICRFLKVLLFCSNQIIFPIKFISKRNLLTFSPLFFKYSACSSILLNTRCINKTLHDEFHF